MLENLNLYIFILFIVIIIIFSSINIKFKNTKSIDNIPIDLLDPRTNTGLQKGIDLNNNSNISKNTVNLHTNTKRGNTGDISGVVGIPSTKQNVVHELWDLPEKDEYMNPLFKEQIDNLKKRYYSDVSYLSSV